jgi:hypothetical protein
MRHAPLALALGALAGCGDINQFDTSYVGERWPAVPSARVVDDAPPDAQARVIGESTFNTTNQFLGDGDAADAARLHGADIVRWERAWEGTATRLEAMPIYQSGMQNRGTFSTYVYVPANKSMWRYFARYYRSAALGGAMDGYVGLPAAAAAPATPPAPAAPAAPAVPAGPAPSPAPVTSRP